MSTKNFPRVKVFSQVFFKKLAGFGAAPHKKLQTQTNYIPYIPLKILTALSLQMIFAYSLRYGSFSFSF